MKIDLKKTDFLYKGVLIILGVISFFKTLILLNETPFANGWDAYFYLDQVKHWFANGELHTLRYSIYYPYLIFIQFFTNNYIFTYKLGIAICSFILTLVFGILPFTLWKNKVLGFALALYSISSLHIIYFGANFAKNYLGITFLFVLVYFIVRKKSHYSQLLLLLVGLFTHKLTAVLGLFVYFGNYLFKIKIKLNKVIIVISSVLFTGIVSLFYFINRERQLDFISLKPQLHLYEFYNEMVAFSQVHRIEFVMLFISSILLIAYGILFKVKKTKLFYITFFLLIAINFPFMKWDLMGYSYRLFILFPFLFIFLISSIQVSKRISLALTLLVSVLFFFKGYNPKNQDPPYIQYQQIVAVIKKANIKSDLIIAHKPLSEFLSFNLNTDVMSWVPEYEVDEEKCWRIVSGMSDKQMEYYSNSQYRKLSIRYHIIKEKEWKEITDKMKEEDLDLFNELKDINPYKERPLFLSK